MTSTSDTAITVTPLEINGGILAFQFEPDGLSPEEFDAFGPTARTLRAFTGSYHELLHQVADALVPNPDVRPVS